MLNSNRFQWELGTKPTQVLWKIPLGTYWHHQAPNSLTLTFSVSQRSILAPCMPLIATNLSPLCSTPLTHGISLTLQLQVWFLCPTPSPLHLVTPVRTPSLYVQGYFPSSSPHHVHTHTLLSPQPPLSSAVPHFSPIFYRSGDTEQDEAAQP